MRTGAGRGRRAAASVEPAVARRRKPEPQRQAALRALMTECADDPVRPSEPNGDDGPGEDAIPELPAAFILGWDEGPGDRTDAASRHLWLRPRVVPSPRLTLWVGADDEVCWDTFVPAPSVAAGHAATEVDHRRFLEALALTLASEFAGAVRARSRAEALLAIGSLSAVALVERMQHYGGASVADTTKLSRAGHLLIGLPCGLVPVEFLTWLGSRGGAGREPQFEAALAYAEGLVAAGLADCPPGDPACGDLRRRTCADLGLPGYEETLRKDVHPNLAAVLTWPLVVRSFQARMPFADDERFSAALGVGVRGQWIRRLAVAGCLDHLLVPRAAALVSALIGPSLTPPALIRPALAGAAR